MPLTTANRVELHYRGTADGPPLVWVLGTGTPGIDEAPLTCSLLGQ